MKRVLLIVTLCLGLASQVHADPAETLGLSWEGRGSAGANLASVSDFSATWYNPGNLSWLQHGQFSTSYVHLFSKMKPNGARTSSGSFLEIGMAVPVFPHPRHPIWLGAAILTPASGFYELDLYPNQEPMFVSLNARERRLSLSMALSGKILSWLSVGAGFEMLPTVDAVVDLDLGDSEGDNSVLVDVGYQLSPIAGLTVQPIEELRLALVYRGRNYTDMTIPVNVVAEGIELQAQVHSRAFYVPHQVGFGIEWSFLEHFSVEADATWKQFSTMPNPSPAVSLFDSDGAEAMKAVPESPNSRDVVVFSTAFRYRGPIEATFGYRFFPAVVKDQTGVSNLLDSDRHTLAAGLRYGLKPSSESPIEIGFHGSLSGTIYTDRVLEKEQILVDNAGYPSLEYGGFRIGASVGLDVRY